MLMRSHEAVCMAAACALLALPQGQAGMHSQPDRCRREVKGLGLACRNCGIEVGEEEHRVGLGGIGMVEPHLDLGAEAPDASDVHDLQRRRRMTGRHTAWSSKLRIAAMHTVAISC